MKGTLLETCRIGLLATLMAASFPEAGFAGLNSTGPIGLPGTRFQGNRNRFVFLVSSTPLESSRGG
jgi:hypothetical protein